MILMMSWGEGGGGGEWRIVDLYVCPRGGGVGIVDISYRVDLILMMS